MHHVDTYACLWVYVPAYMRMSDTYTVFHLLPHLHQKPRVLSCCSHVYIRLCRHHLKTNQNTFPSFFFFFSLPFNTTVNWDIHMAKLWFFVRWCESEREHVKIFSQGAQNLFSYGPEHFLRCKFFNDFLFTILGPPGLIQSGSTFPT